MSLRSFASPPLDLQTPFLPGKNAALLFRNPRIREDLFIRKRRRRCPLVRSGLEDFFQNLISAFPSPNSLDLIAPVLGFASGAALSLSSSQQRLNPKVDGDETLGDWILYTSPTPFNRCVLLRCPSVSFEDGGELLDGVNERLVREERHYVNLSRGRIPARKGGNGKLEREISYQRVCLGTDDGGVISLDWPDNLDLEKEYGLDTTVLIVPGTAEGSMDRNVRMFVYDALMHGCFPIVMNPRGCAGSPLTTARLFTAADSDDICTATQFINRLRPWTTLTSIGWGYGANMLTKYLAEVGETTALTAAVCIDNPFDLEEATRSFPHYTAMDQKLTSGLIDILRANKELFQGKAKGFDVAKALNATSVRCFDEAISMVSYGCDDIEEFYSKASTRQLVRNMKIPVLFIQSGEGAVPLFSVPRSSIAENPFTSLLLCSCLPSASIKSEKSAILWCQHIAIEWLSAVELALLKGRHPLLKDVDITINPSKGLALVDGRASERSISARSKVRGSYDPAQLFSSRKNLNRDTLVKLTQSNSVNRFLSDTLTNAKESDLQDNFNQHSEAGSELHEMQRDDDAGTKQEKNADDFQKNSIGNVNLADGGGDGPIENEGSHVLQTAAVVMNMLDVTMPGTLDEEQKKKVLTATEQGETLMKALQGAVPQDVRGKLTTVVTEILQTQSTNLNLDGLKRIGWIPNVTSEVKSRIQEKLSGISATEVGHNDNYISDQTIRGAGSEGSTPEDSTVLNSGNNSTQESIESSQEKAAQGSAYVETGSEEGCKQSQPNKLEKASGDIDDTTTNQVKVNQSHGIADTHSSFDQVVVNDVNDVHNNNGKKMDFVAEQTMPISSSKSEEKVLASSSTSEHQAIGKEGNEVPKNEDKIIQNIADQNVQSSSTKSEETLPHHLSSKPPSISVTQALDALTGFDDSTQVAVNSVFGVLENMIDHFEKASTQRNEEEMNKIKDQDSVNTSHDFPRADEDKSEKNEDNSSRSGIESEVIQPTEQLANNIHEEGSDSYEKLEGTLGEKKVVYSLTSSLENSNSRSEENDADFNHFDSTNSSKVEHVPNFPLEIAMNPYWESLYDAYLQRYLPARLPINQSFDSETTTDLFLDPDEGQWKMLNHIWSTRSRIDESRENGSINGKGQTMHSSSRESNMEEIIEPSYVILDAEYSRFEHQANEDCDAIDSDSKEEDSEKEELRFLVKNTLLNALKVEVGRRLGMPDLDELESNILYDVEQVADAVSQAVVLDSGLNLHSFCASNDSGSAKFGTVEGEHIIKSISSAVQDAGHLRKVLPVGVIVGSSLASLRKHFQVAVHDQSKSIHKTGNIENVYCQESDIKTELCVDDKDQYADSDYSLSKYNRKNEAVDSDNDGIMVGAVTAALGASALLAHHQRKKIYKHDETMGTRSSSSNEKGFSHVEHFKLEEAMQEKNQNNLVESLAEKAMSVAGPVVPTKNDGELDQERLVAILADLGQKGGILRLIGKIALLWGGVRGAMSLTDRLISFLHIAERPLFQRFGSYFLRKIWSAYAKLASSCKLFPVKVLGFVCMVLVLWSPVVIPLLPTLVQNWTTKASNGIAELACIIGLYVAIMILVMQWGKRIRGYDDPLEQYGLDLTSAPRVHEFIKGLVGGMMIVLCIHSVNALLGFACLSWPSFLPSSAANAVILLKACGNVLVHAVRGFVTATGIAVVEELLFRSWLAEEVAVDLGYYRSIMISGVAFSLFQRSLPSVPSFLLLSLALFGIKQRAHGKLAAPVGMQAGIMTANFILQSGPFLTYRPGTPFWLTSTHPWHPFEGAVGLSFCAVLAIVFYPRQPLQKKKGSMVSE